MAQQIESKSLLPVEQSDQFPKLKPFFDRLEYIAKRTGQLLEKTEFLIFKLAFWLFLIFKMAEYGWYLIKNWH